MPPKCRLNLWVPVTPRLLLSQTNEQKVAARERRRERSPIVSTDNGAVGGRLDDAIAASPPEGY